MCQRLPLVCDNNKHKHTYSYKYTSMQEGTAPIPPALCFQAHGHALTRVRGPSPGLACPLPPLQASRGPAPGAARRRASRPASPSTAASRAPRSSP